MLPDLGIVSDTSKGKVSLWPLTRTCLFYYVKVFRYAIGDDETCGWPLCYFVCLDAYFLLVFILAPNSFRVLVIIYFSYQHLMVNRVLFPMIPLVASHFNLALFFLATQY